jgi:hypothetical protein
MDNQIKSVGFSLKKVTTEQFAIIEEEFDEKGKIMLNSSIRVAADEIHKYIAVYTLFIFESENKPFLIIEAGCHFAIEEHAWSDMYDNELNILRISKEFLTHLAMLTVGTSRGILHAKTEGTCFNKYVLPTINITQLIKEDAAISFNKTDEPVS